LFDLFSDDLANAQPELLILLEQRGTLDNSIINFDLLTASARQKLHLFGMTDIQVQELEKRKTVNLTTPVYSPVGGVIAQLNFREGDYVMEGSSALQVTDLRHLWVEAQVFASQLDGIGRGTAAMVRFPDLVGPDLRGTIQFGNPEVSASSRFLLLRVAIANPVDGINRVYLHTLPLKTDELTY